MDDRLLDVEAIVRAFIQTALRASTLDDIGTFVRSRTDAVGLYELNPSLAQAPNSRLRALLLFIRAAHSDCEAQGRSTSHLRMLHERAARLTQLFH
jgi:hypothetical protein